MKRQVLFEGLLLLIIGIISIREGYILILYKNPRVLYDVMGPGPYVLFLGLVISITAVTHILVNKRRIIDKISFEKETGIRLIGTILAFIIYILLLQSLSYNCLDYSPFSRDVKNFCLLFGRVSSRLLLPLFFSLSNLGL